MNYLWNFFYFYGNFSLKKFSFKDFRNLKNFIIFLKNFAIVCHRHAFASFKNSELTELSIVMRVT